MSMDKLCTKLIVYTVSMNEEIPQEPSPEKLEAQEQEGRYRHWIKTHPVVEIPLSERGEDGPEIAEFEEMIASFEATHSLSELHSITELASEDAPNHLIREPARLGLIPIVAKLNILKAESNISPERHDELKARYKILSNAVGILNNGEVDHNR